MNLILLDPLLIEFDLHLSSLIRKFLRSVLQGFRNLVNSLQFCTLNNFKIIQASHLSALYGITSGFFKQCGGKIWIESKGGVKNDLWYNSMDDADKKDDLIELHSKSLLRQNFIHQKLDECWYSQMAKHLVNTLAGNLYDKKKKFRNRWIIEYYFLPSITKTFLDFLP